MNEYIRRLVHIGFSESEAFQLFSYESLNMKHDSIALLQRPTYLADFYFNLKIGYYRARTNTISNRGCSLFRR